MQLIVHNDMSNSEKDKFLFMYVIQIINPKLIRGRIGQLDDLHPGHDNEIMLKLARVVTTSVSC